MSKMVLFWREGQLGKEVKNENVLERFPVWKKHILLSHVWILYINSNNLKKSYLNNPTNQHICKGMRNHMFLFCYKWLPFGSKRISTPFGSNILNIPRSTDPSVFDSFSWPLWSHKHPYLKQIIEKYMESSRTCLPKEATPPGKQPAFGGRRVLVRPISQSSLQPGLSSSAAYVLLSNC